MSVEYETADGVASTRLMRPLAMHFWGERWTLAAWCELRNDFRAFRLNRMRTLTITDRAFAQEAGKTFADYLRKIKCDFGV